MGTTAASSSLDINSIDYITYVEAKGYFLIRIPDPEKRGRYIQKCRSIGSKNGTYTQTLKASIQVRNQLIKEHWGGRKALDEYSSRRRPRSSFSSNSSGKSGVVPFAQRGGLKGFRVNWQEGPSEDRKTKSICFYTHKFAGGEREAWILACKERDKRIGQRVLSDDEYLSMKNDINWEAMEAPAKPSRRGGRRGQNSAGASHSSASA